MVKPLLSLIPTIGVAVLLADTPVSTELAFGVIFLTALNGLGWMR